MEPPFWPIDGDVVQTERLMVPRAREFAQYVQDGASSFVTLQECRRATCRTEVVVVDVQATVPQHPAVALQRRERLAVHFGADDRRSPDVRALRVDFPRECVLHINLVPASEAVSLCLFAEPWPDVRLRLTANELLFRIQTWLQDTASGSLHRADQPLEPAFIARPWHLMVAPELLDRVASGAGDIRLRVVGDGANFAWIEHREEMPGLPAAATAVVVPLVSRPHEHCIIHTHPDDLAELAAWLEPLGIDAVAALQTRLLPLEQRGELGSKEFVVLLLLMRRVRASGADPEPQLVAFLCTSPAGPRTGLTGLAKAIGLGGIGDASRRGGGVPVSFMSTHLLLGPDRAAQYSGNEPNNSSLMAIGAGALGSQVVMQAARGGLARWHVIDHDLLLPHNLVRHAVTGEWLGRAKAIAVATEANRLFGAPTVSATVADVLDLGDEGGAVLDSVSAVSAIVDMSASTAVGRHLGVDMPGSAQRCSIFVSPSGHDLVFLGENAQRTVRLDLIEAQYYRAVADDARLRGHLAGGRSIGSCRSVTSRVPQHLMGMHAAQAVRLLRCWLDSGSPMAVVLRTSDESMSVVQVDIPLADPVSVGTLGGWRVWCDAALLAELHRQREQQLPSETGGVLLAHVDVQRHTLYVAHQMAAPPDSERQPTHYIRGCAGLETRYDQVREGTLQNLAYIGEWHSHPDTAACAPSRDDLLAGTWLAERTRLGSLPGIMLIVGGHDEACWMLCSQSDNAAPVCLHLEGGAIEEDR